MLDVPRSKYTKDLGRLTQLVNWFFVLIFGRAFWNSPRYQLVSVLARPFGRELMQALFHYQRGGVRAAFDIPDHLASKWELSK
jgi:hypothetical protein